MRKIFPILLFICVIVFGNAQSVNKAEVTQVAVNFLNNNKIDSKNMTSNDIDTVIVFNKNNNNLLYEVIFKSGEWILLSGHKGCTPILAFSLTNNLYRDFDNNRVSILRDTTAIPNALSIIINNYIDEIEICYQKSLTDYVSLWKNYLMNENSTNKSTKEVVVLPMMTTKWGQDVSNDTKPAYVDHYAYNAYTPSGIYCTQHCAAGCSAVAMAQILKMYSYPSELPFRCYDFDWLNMPDSLKQRHNNYYSVQKDATARLIYDCGVDMKIVYCSDTSEHIAPNSCASSTYGLSQVIDAFKKYGYAEVYPYYENNYANHTEWVNKVALELFYGRPLYYIARGYSGKKSVGHAFVCDGYYSDNNTTTNFHVNWGWNGRYDGWYRLDNLNPSITFNMNQAAIFNIYPTSCYQDIIMECNRNFASGTSKEYALNGTFSNNNHEYTISQGASIHLQAGKEILLTDGFYAAEGSDFEAIIAPCGSSSYLAINENSDADTAQNVKSLQKQTSSDNEIKIFPNPTTGELNIELSNPEETVSQIEILNITGNVIMRLKNVNSGIDLSSLPSGLYVARVTISSSNVYHSKFIKN